MPPKKRATGKKNRTNIKDKAGLTFAPGILRAKIIGAKYSAAKEAGVAAAAFFDTIARELKDEADKALEENRGSELKNAPKTITVRTIQDAIWGYHGKPNSAAYTSQGSKGVVDAFQREGGDPDLQEIFKSSRNMVYA